MRNNAKKTIMYGITFDSKLEADRYLFLKSHEDAGNIRNLKVHTKHWLVVGERPVLVKSERYPNGRRASYTDDFSYESNASGYWTGVIEDVKGFDTSTARFRRGVFEAIDGVTVRIVKNAAEPIE